MRLTIAELEQQAIDFDEPNGFADRPLTQISVPFSGTCPPLPHPSYSRNVLRRKAE